MSTSIPKNGWLPRETIMAHASGLRERILKGECPCPDAAMEANEALVARLGGSRGR